MVVSFSSSRALKTVIRTLALIVLAGAFWLWLDRSYLSQSSHDVRISHHVVPSSYTPANVAQMRLSDLLYPMPSTLGDPLWVKRNHKQMRAFLRCVENANCGANQMKVVILLSHHFRLALYGNSGGEKIWARSTAQALQNLGYTYIYTTSLDHTLAVYQTFPSLVRAIIADPEDVEDCMVDTWACSSSAGHPSGIPPYKLFSFAFWAHPQHPLGEKWTLSPEDYNELGMGNNTYLGYSVEAACMQHSFVPHAQREDDAYVLAKLLSLFTVQRERVWAPEVLDAATRATGVRYVLGASNEMDGMDWGEPGLPMDYVNVGKMGQFAFLERLSHAKVLIGMGHPMTSPTPYDALCLGVPFINPLRDWDPEDPADRTHWSSQHPPLARLSPPYVYNVRADDTQGFVDAVKQAMERPIAGLVLERMRIESVERRLAAILEHDWESEGLEAMKEWEAQATVVETRHLTDPAQLEEAF